MNEEYILDKEELAVKTTEKGKYHSYVDGHYTKEGILEIYIECTWGKDFVIKEEWIKEGNWKRTITIPYDKICKRCYG